MKRVGHTQMLGENERICDVKIKDDSREINSVAGTSQPTYVMNYADAVRGEQKSNT